MNLLDDATVYLSRALKASKLLFGKSRECVAPIYNDRGNVKSTALCNTGRIGIVYGSDIVDIG